MGIPPPLPQVEMWSNSWLPGSVVYSWACLGDFTQKICFRSKVRCWRNCMCHTHILPSVCIYACFFNPSHLIEQKGDFLEQFFYLWRGQCSKT